MTKRMARYLPAAAEPKHDARSYNRRMSAVAERLTRFFERRAHGAIAVYLFGSAARGDARPGSDVDIAVLFDAPPEATLDGPRLTLEGELEAALGLSVDLVSLNTAPPDLVHRVLRDGIIVFDDDRARRIRFEVARRNEYFDLEPIRRRYRKTAAGAGSS